MAVPIVRSALAEDDGKNLLVKKKVRHRSDELVRTPASDPAQAEMGEDRNHSLESPAAAGGLSHDRASLQSALEAHEADDGEQDLCRGHLSETSVPD